MVTPFREDDSIDFDSFQRLARHLVDHGSDGVVVAGTTGESPTLTHREGLRPVRPRLGGAGGGAARAAAAVAPVAGAATVVAGTGTYSTAHSVHLTEDARELDVDGLLV